MTPERTFGVIARTCPSRVAAKMVLFFKAVA